MNPVSLSNKLNITDEGRNCLTIPNITNFGIYPINNLSDGLRRASFLGTYHIRMTIDLASYGQDDINQANAFTNAGQGLILTVNSNSNTGENFPTDLAAYKITLDSMLAKVKPEVISVENEELNENYHTGTVDQYLAELNTAIEVAHFRDIKVTNGGLTTTLLPLLVYNYYRTTQQFTEAKSFAKRAIDPSKINANGNIVPGEMDKVNEGVALLAGLAQSDIDYINIHYYEPVIYRNTSATQRTLDSVRNVSRDVLQEIADYLTKVTNKPVMSNEMGQENKNPGLVTGMLTNASMEGLVYCLWFDGDGDNSFGLFDSDGTARTNAEYFAMYIRSLNN